MDVAAVSAVHSILFIVSHTHSFCYTQRDPELRPAMVELRPAMVELRPAMVELRPVMVESKVMHGNPEMALNSGTIYMLAWISGDRISAHNSGVVLILR